MSSILGIDVEKENNGWMKSINQFFKSIPVLWILFILFSVLVSSAVRIQNSSYDFTTKLNAALILIAISESIIILLNIGAHVKNTGDLYQTLQVIVDNEGIAFDVNSFLCERKIQV